MNRIYVHFTSRFLLSFDLHTPSSSLNFYSNNFLTFFPKTDPYILRKVQQSVEDTCIVLNIIEDLGFRLDDGIWRQCKKYCIVVRMCNKWIKQTYKYLKKSWNIIRNYSYEPLDCWKSKPKSFKKQQYCFRQKLKKKKKGVCRVLRPISWLINQIRKIVRKQKLNAKNCVEFYSRKMDQISILQIAT